MPPAMSKDQSQTSAVSKRKKPPACDYCKARRVICHPQPDGKPCPRCVEKEVVLVSLPSHLVAALALIDLQMYNNTDCATQASEETCGEY